MTILQLASDKIYFGWALKMTLMVAMSVAVLVGSNMVIFVVYKQPSFSQELGYQRLQQRPLQKNNTSYNKNNPQLVDLTYIEVPKGKHPHKGAFSPHPSNQTGVFVFDVTHLKNNPPPFPLTEEQLRRECNKHDKTYQALQRIRVAKPTGKHKTKILCGIYGMEKSRGKYQSIRETWGPRCDGFFVASDQTHPDYDAVYIAHAGPEVYDNMYQKVRSIWAYVYDHYYNDFDWFHLGGDDMFVIVDNLRYYLESDEIVLAANGGSSVSSSHSAKQQVPLFLGGTIAYRGNTTKLYQTGGPGYTLNKAALKKLVLEGLPTTPNNYKVPYEDMVVSRLFREMNVSIYRTTDQNNGVRYHHYSPDAHYFGREPGFYKTWTKPLNYNRGNNFSSVHSIAFHYINPDNMRRFYALLFGLCDGISRL